MLAQMLTVIPFKRVIGEDMYRQSFQTIEGIKLGVVRAEVTFN
jgi:hypothetical protein